MSNEQKLREIAYKHAEPKVIWNDGNMSIYPDEEKIESLLSDLTALISGHYYPKEFVRWMFQGCPFIIGENGVGNIIAFSVNDGRQFTLDELFYYWKENVQEDEHPTNKEKFDGNYLPDTDENR